MGLVLEASPASGQSPILAVSTRPLPTSVLGLERINPPPLLCPGEHVAEVTPGVTVKYGPPVIAVDHGAARIPILMPGRRTGDDISPTRAPELTAGARNFFG